ncbi:MAG: V-type ATPase subunit [Candidatus Baldrarchaeia archaeon]
MQFRTKSEFIYHVSKSVSYGYPFYIGSILCYLNLKWFEVKNLKTIVVGKEERVIPLHIRKYLIY